MTVKDLPFDDTMSDEVNSLFTNSYDNLKTSCTIDDITMEPDRYGVIHPVLAMDSNLHYNNDLITIKLPSMHNLVDHGYLPGQVIELSKSGSMIIPGQVLDAHYVTRGINTGYQQFVEQNVCHYCTHKLYHSGGAFYCVNPLCGATIRERVEYACKKELFDIPFDVNDVHTLYLEDRAKIVAPLHWTFMLAAEELENVYAEPEIITTISQALRKTQLQIASCASDQINQNKFLDILSIPGLQGKNITILQNYLCDKPQVWTNLYDLLTDLSFLVSIGINRQDAQMIVHHTTYRKPDVVALTKLGQVPYDLV